MEGIYWADGNATCKLTVYTFFGNYITHNKCG
jgi:hypothetical protein